MEGTSWENRIVGHGDVDPETLLANPLNWRIHPEAQQEALQSVLEDVGWVQRIIVNKNTGFVVDGHLRVALALRNEITSIPVEYVDLTPEQEHIVLMMLDPLAAMAATDQEKLSDLLDEVTAERPDILNDPRYESAMDHLMAEIATHRFEPPSLDDLEKEVGELSDEDMTTFLKIKVTYKSIELYYQLMDMLSEHDHTKAIHEIFVSAKKELLRQKSERIGK